MRQLFVFLALLVPMLLYGQDIDSFRGVVTDPDGETLIGAYIVDKNSGKSALTDESGEFFIDKLEFPAVLTVSYLGFTDQEFTLTRRRGSRPCALML